MGAGPETLASRGADQDAERLELHRELSRIAEGGIHGEIDEVGDGGFDGEPGNQGDPVGEKPGVFVVVAEPLDVVFEGVDCGGGHHPSLSKGTAEEFSDVTGLGDVVLIPHKDGPHGATETFGETNRDGVEVAANFGRSKSTGNGGIEEACSVEVHFETVRPGPVTDASEVFASVEVATAEVGRIFEADEAGAGEMLVDGADFPLQLRDIQESIFSFDQSAGDPAEGGWGTGFEIGDVAAGFDEEFIAGVAMNANSHLIGLGSGAGVDSGLLAEDFTAHPLKPIDGGILGDHVVADFGGGDGGPHCRGGSGDGVAAHVDGLSGHFFRGS